MSPNDHGSPQTSGVPDHSESPTSPNDHDSDDHSNAPAKPGRKKNPNSQTARRDQNRIAQRQFRMRKQQRIRDLEARVEILSGSREDSFKEIRSIMQDLIKENATLRQMVKDLSGFLGNGEGGFLPKLGWSWDEFSTFIDRAETDTAFQSFASRRRATQPPEAEPSNNKRPAEEQGPSASSHKRTRLDSDASSQTRLPFPFSPVAASPIGAWPNVGNMGLNAPSRQINGDAYLTMTPPVEQTPVLHDFQIPQALNHSNIQMLGRLSGLAPEHGADDTGAGLDDKLHEAIKLVKYHLDNFRRNESYCLPPSLRPSLVQRTVPHESIIDELVNPDLRDSMILLRNRYDLIDCLHDFPANLEVHGDDVLAHANWEFKEPWLRKWGFLVEQPLLNICNRWRRERGELDLSLADIRGKGKEI